MPDHLDIGGERRHIGIARGKHRAPRLEVEGVATEARVAVRPDRPGHHALGVAEEEGRRLDDDDPVLHVPAQFYGRLVEEHRFPAVRTVAEGDVAGADVEADRGLFHRPVGAELRRDASVEGDVGGHAARRLAEPREDVDQRQFRKDPGHDVAAGRRIGRPLERRRPAPAIAGRREIRRHVAGRRVDRNADIGIGEAALLQQRGVPQLDVAANEGELEEARLDGPLERLLQTAIEDAEGGEEIGESAVRHVGGRIGLGSFTRQRRVDRGGVAEIDRAVVGADERNVGAGQFHRARDELEPEEPERVDRDTRLRQRRDERIDAVVNFDVVDLDDETERPIDIDQRPSDGDPVVGTDGGLGRRLDPVPDHADFGRAGQDDGDRTDDGDDNQGKDDCRDDQRDPADPPPRQRHRMTAGTG